MDENKAKKSHENESKDQNEFEDVTDTDKDVSETKSDEIQDVDSEIATMKDQLLRALAEAENIRKRAAQDKEEALKYGASAFARDMISISDNLRRALDHMEKKSLSDEVKAFIEGVELTENELLTAFAKHKIKRIDPLGEKFDSHLHQAMFEEESKEYEPGTVIEVMQPGYTIHDRLLRPAMVGVAKKKA